MKVVIVVISQFFVIIKVAMESIGYSQRTLNVDKFCSLYTLSAEPANL